VVRRTACSSDTSIQVAAQAAVALANFTTGQIGRSASEARKGRHGSGPIN
jgi:hypothetical protein